MSRFLLDTSTISAPVLRRPVARVVRKLELHSQDCALAAPVWHELVFGCRRLPAGARRKRLEAYLREVVAPSFPILPYDEAAAGWHAEERARLESAGRPPPFVDGQIAAVAAVNGLVLVTANTKDFARFEGLELADWSK
jgi:tRNA(fMet)-specific endonuclease VapC